MGAEMLMHAIAHGGRTYTGREVALEADSWNKVPSAPTIRTHVIVAPGVSVGRSTR